MEATAATLRALDQAPPSSPPPTAMPAAPPLPTAEVQARLRDAASRGFCASEAMQLSRLMEERSKRREEARDAALAAQARVAACDREEQEEMAAFAPIRALLFAKEKELRERHAQLARTLPQRRAQLSEAQRAMAEATRELGEVRQAAHELEIELEIQGGAGGGSTGAGGPA